VGDKNFNQIKIHKKNSSRQAAIFYLANLSFFVIPSPWRGICGSPLKIFYISRGN
jgi:hypothetical protein